jgi:hypothetical protein
MEPPIRIKLYGLVSMTKRGYLTQLAFVVVLLVLLLILWLSAPPAVDLKDAPPEVVHSWVYQVGVRVRPLMDYLPWVILACALLCAVEAVFVLRRFAREEEAKRRARHPETPPRT